MQVAQIQAQWELDLVSPSLLCCGTGPLGLLDTFPSHQSSETTLLIEVMACLMTGGRPVCQPCMRKHGRGARCQRTSPIAANEDISRDRVKYLESWLADLEHRGFANTAFHGTQDEKLELS
jgi:hypothetical protein